MDILNTGQGQQLSNARIMMLDDEPLIIDLIQIFLADLGYNNFTGLTDSETAVAQITEQLPDLLFLDLVMPKVDGFQVLDALRSHEATQHLPVIVLTSSSDAESKLRALELGATDFLSKPINESELALRLRNILTVKAFQNQLMYYDSLTGLPNRKLCFERLTQNLERAQKQREKLAVLSLNLYGLRNVQDRLGITAGDQIVKLIAADLVECVRSSDLVSFSGFEELWRNMGRIGDDEFLIVLSKLKQESDATFVANRLLEILKRPYQYREFDVVVDSCVGISTYPADGAEPKQLMEYASQAAGEAVHSDEKVQYFSGEANQRLQERVALESCLRQALAAQEFTLNYQPQVDALTRQVVGAEALLRWQHPEQGFISPAIFVPIAESCGLMEELGNWVLEQACRQAAHWQQAGLNLSISVNVSSRQFNGSHFSHTVQRCLDETGVKPRNIMIELTEGIAVSNVDSNIELLHDLKRLGVELSVDDFGTGYSSLRYLKDFPLDELKVDKSFVDGLPGDAGDAAIVGAIMMMAKHLGMKIVAEGVETVEQYNYLKAQGCDVIQGYYFSKPLPADAFEAYYWQHNQ